MSIELDVAIRETGGSTVVRRLEDIRSNAKRSANEIKLVGASADTAGQIVGAFYKKFNFGKKGMEKLFDAIKPSGEINDQIEALTKLINIAPSETEALYKIFKIGGIQFDGFRQQMLRFHKEFVNATAGNGNLAKVLQQYDTGLDLTGKRAEDLIPVFLELSDVVKSTNSKIMQLDLVEAAFGDQLGVTVPILKRGSGELGHLIARNSNEINDKKIQSMAEEYKNSAKLKSSYDTNIGQILELVRPGMDAFYGVMGAVTKPVADFAKNQKEFSVAWKDMAKLLEGTKTSDRDLLKVRAREIHSTISTLNDAIELLHDGKDDALSSGGTEVGEVNKHIEELKNRILEFYHLGKNASVTEPVLKDVFQIHSSLSGVSVNELVKQTPLTYEREEDKFPSLVSGEAILKSIQDLQQKQLEETKDQTKAIKEGEGAPALPGKSLPDVSMPPASVPPTSVQGMPRDCCEELKALLEKFVPGGGKAGDGKPVHGSAGDDVLPDRAAFDKVLKGEQARTNQAEATADAYGEQARQADALGDLVAATNEDLVQQTDIGDTILESNQALLEIEKARTAEQKTQLDQLGKLGKGVNKLNKDTQEFADILGPAIADLLKVGIDRSLKLASIPWSYFKSRYRQSVIGLRRWIDSRAIVDKTFAVT